MSNSILNCNIDFKAFPDVKAALENALGDGEFMMLGKISSISGADSTTIQNWVKRSFVSKANGKKYSRQQAVEIVLLNALKDALSLERAASIVENAKQAGNTDAVTIFTVLSNVLLRADSFNTVDRDGLEGLVDDELYSLNIQNGTLSSYILVMALACISASYKEKAEEEFQKIG